MANWSNKPCQSHCQNGKNSVFQNLWKHKYYPLNARAWDYHFQTEVVVNESLLLHKKWHVTFRGETWLKWTLITTLPQIVRGTINKHVGFSQIGGWFFIEMLSGFIWAINRLWKLHVTFYVVKVTHIYIYNTTTTPPWGILPLEARGKCGVPLDPAWPPGSKNVLCAQDFQPWSAWEAPTGSWRTWARTSPGIDFLEKLLKQRLFGM